MQINTNKSFIIHYNDVNDSEMKEKKAIKIYCVCQVVWLWCNVFVCLHSKSKLYTQCRNDDSKIVSSNNKRYGCIETERNEERERKKNVFILSCDSEFLTIGWYWYGLCFYMCAGLKRFDLRIETFWLFSSFFFLIVFFSASTGLDLSQAEKPEDGIYWMEMRS